MQSDIKTTILVILKTFSGVAQPPLYFTKPILEMSCHPFGSSLEGLRTITLLTLCFKLCKQLVCVSAMNFRVGNEIESFEQTRLLFLDHGIYESRINRKTGFCSYHKGCWNDLGVNFKDLSLILLLNQLL